MNPKIAELKLGSLSIPTQRFALDGEFRDILLNNLMNVDKQELLQACNLAWLTINPGTPKQSIEKELNRLEIKKDLEQ